MIDHVDPEHTLRGMYDPSGVYDELTDAALFEEVAENRAAIELPDLGEITPYESMYLEAKHALAPVPDIVRRHIPEDRIRDLSRFEAYRTQRMINHVSYVAYSRQLQKDPRLASYELAQSSIDTIDGELDTMLYAVRVLAHITHDGVFRRSGRPYITHPESVASIVDVGWNRGAQDQPFESLRRHKAVAYLHDTFEDTVTSDGSYLSHEIISSPLVIQGLLTRYNLQRSTEVARAVRLMSHTKGALPGTDKMSYADYIERGVTLGGAQFAIPKAADIQHNSFIDVDTSLSTDETQEQKKARRSAKYENSKNELLVAANAFPDRDSRWVLHTIFQVTGPQMERVYGQLKDIHLRDDELRLSS